MTFAAAFVIPLLDHVKLGGIKLLTGDGTFGGTIVAASGLYG